MLLISVILKLFIDIVINSLYVPGMMKYIKAIIVAIPPNIGAIPMKKFPAC